MIVRIAAMLEALNRNSMPMRLMRGNNKREKEAESEREGESEREREREIEKTTFLMIGIYM